MKTRTLPTLLPVCLALVAANGPCLGQTPSPASSPASPSSEAQIPRAQFDGNLPNGRDPFTLRPPEGQVNPGKTNGVTNKPLVPSQFVLKGISGSKEKWFAVINTGTFNVGEEKEVVTANGKVKVRCEVITEDSAVIWAGVPAERIELRLQRRPLK